MSHFYVAIDLAGRPVDGNALAEGAVSTGVPELALHESWGAVWTPSPTGRPGVVHRHGVLAIGDVRITNRRDFPVRPGLTRRPEDDLALVVDQYHRRGVIGLGELVGDFAAVLWDTRRRRLVAFRDALGVRSLFVRRSGDRIALSSRLECFDGDDLDREVLADFLLGRPAMPGPTVHRGVERIGPGTILVAEQERTEIREYWNPAGFAPADRVADPAAAVAEFRERFDQAVQAQFDDGLRTWSQLSGGLDSSAVVVTAEALADQGRIAGLSGTQTIVDSLSDGDETRYSDLVLARHDLPSSRVTDFWAWQDDGAPPPRVAEPQVFLPFYARDRALRKAVTDGGAAVVLSGYGSDNYLAGTFDHIADLVAAGRLGRAAGQLIDLAVASRRSVWEMGRRHVLGPLAPPWLGGRRGRTPSWVRAAAEAPARGAGAFAREQALNLAGIDGSLARGIFEEGMELRYPFLHRPLVEFCLQLPIDLRFRPNRPKWILREALADRLPKAIRNRMGKGGIDGRVVWSFGHERAALQRMIRQSRLADLGLVEPAALTAALDRAAAGELGSTLALFRTLSLETWFAVRSGWRVPPALPPAPPTPLSSKHEEIVHV